MTEKAVARLSIKARPYTVWDELQTGLGIAVRRSGKKVWKLQLRFPGGKAQSKRTLGTFPALGVAAAREKAASSR